MVCQASWFETHVGVVMLSHEATALFPHDQIFQVIAGDLICSSQYMPFLSMKKNFQSLRFLACNARTLNVGNHQHATGLISPLLNTAAARSNVSDELYQVVVAMMNYSECSCQATP